MPSPIPADNGTYFPRSVARATTYVLENYGRVDTALNTIAALAAVVEAINTSGTDGVVDLPPGNLLMDADPATDVALHEGSGLRLTSAVSNITFRGNETTIKPVANTIEMFTALGIPNLTFEGIKFVNDYGILQGEVQAPTVIPGGGIAGAGNGANCAIRIGKPCNLTVRRCHFAGFSHHIHYIGDWEDDEILGGSIVLENVTFDSYVFGLLAEQYTHGKFTDVTGFNGVDREDFGGDTAAGHLFYGANRSGAEPITLTIKGFSAYNATSSPIKVRKGRSVTINGAAFVDVGRGFDLENLHALTVSDWNVKLAAPVADSFRSGMHLTGLANYEIGPGVVDRSGVSALGVQIEMNAGQGSAPHDKNGRLGPVTIIDDLAGATNRPAVIADGVTDIVIDAPIYRTTANVPNTGYAVELTGDCSRVNVIRPKRYSAEGSNPSGSDRLVLIGANCDKTYVEYAANDLHVAITADTIKDNGTNTTELLVA